MGYLTIDNFKIEEGNFWELLATYRLLPSFKRELAIDRVIASITIAPEEINLALQQFQQRYKLISQEAIQNYCQAYSLTDLQLKEIALREFKIEKFKQQTWGNRLESTFLNRRTSLDRVIYSLIRHKNPELLQELFFRIQDGEQTFAEVASQYSQGVEAQTGGMIGPLLLNKLPSALIEKLRHSIPQQIHSPFPLEEWFVILRLEKFMPAQFDDQTTQLLLNQLFEELLQEQTLQKKF
ncbi:peptidylprolyl isomerase [Pseudanabaena sp. BC1403]|uniref:peptidylprolyl isomerase n=1 Tax=Pseudanabaena sp. BC1403 TaxID=2043171 RepID=UPI0021562C24|nr:peptidylprolyl isomerase [Pseudanabaena sp. BC1403]